MGASQSQPLPETKPDITKCSICKEEFKTPVRLPCLHTFCYSCLNSFIISAFESEPTSAKFEFLCPLCSCIVFPPDPSAKYQEWAKLFPMNHMIVSMIEQNKLKTKIKTCDPCQLTNDDVTAVNWCLECNEALCENCANVHKKLKISKDHILKNINELDRIPLITSLQTCDHHIGKRVEAFCRDHNQPCCSSCVAIHHRKCDQVITLQEAAKGVVNSKKLSGLLQRLDDISALNKTLIQEKRDIIQTMENQKNDIQKELQEFRKKIMNTFDKHQTKFMQEFAQKHNRIVKKITDSIEEIENKEKIIQNFTNVIKAGKTGASETHVFLEMRKILERGQNDVEVLEQILSKHESVVYEFRVNDDLEKIVTKLRTIGHVNVVENASLSDKKYPKIANP